VSTVTMQDRLAIKTPEAAFLHVLQTEFNFSSRVSREVLNTAQAMLVGGASAAAVRPGQVRLVVASLPIDTMRGLKKEVVSGKLHKKSNSIQGGAYHERNGL
jgi:hypothetical protein